MDDIPDAQTVTCVPQGKKPMRSTETHEAGEGEKQSPDQTRGGAEAARPSFLITIDTEGDNLWTCPREITTENARFLPRFQQLCEQWGLKPVYLTDYDMVRSEPFVEFGRDLIARGAGEIGMHLHAWSTPPEYALTADDRKYCPYLIEYPEEIMRQMVDVVTDLLERAFDVKMISHRAGRWAFDETYAKLLVDRGYRVDCSVTPHVSWRDHKGRPDGDGGTDYRGYPEASYFIDPDDIARPGASALLEVPMTVMPCRAGTVNNLRRRLRDGSFLWRAVNRFFPPRTWLRPNGRNLSEMLGVVKRGIREGRDYVEFMLHSSELMPGGSRRFGTERRIEELYEHLAALFEAASKSYRGATLNEYHELRATTPR